MKIRTLLLLACFFLVLSELLAPRHHRHIDWSADDIDLLTHGAIDLNIPDEISNTGSECYSRIEGSAVGMLAPDGFAGSVDFHGFDKNKDTTINVVEDHKVGFTAFRRTIAEQLALLTKYAQQDVTLLYSKEFKFNGYEATALYLYDKASHLTYIFMAFGDEHFSVTMRGTCHADDLSDRNAILSAMLTASYDRGNERG